MKVLHVINNLGSGGAESMLINFFKELKNSDDYFEILLLVDDVISYENIPSHIKITTLTNSNKKYSIKKIIALYHYVKNNSFDIIHSHLFPTQYYVFFVKVILGDKIKIVTTEHNTTNKRRNYWLLKQIDKLIYNKYDRIIFISKGVQNQFKKDYPNLIGKGVIINNGIPLNDFYPSNIVKINTNTINLIMVASFSKQKDHYTLIKAMSILDKNYTLSLVGEGKNSTKIKTLVKTLNLDERVHFLGFRNDIAHLYRNHDIFVLSSHWEGFGLVVVEAMASGLPVIASNVEGVNEIVKNNGLLFHPKDAKELANHIKNISKDEKLRNNIIKKGLERAKDFDIKTLVTNSLTMYKKL
jgi:glycosyltransferase involved in cell wall biosynthesis